MSPYVSLVRALLDAGAEPVSEFVHFYGTKVCDSGWHAEGHSFHSACPSCGGGQHERLTVRYGKHVRCLLRVPEGALDDAMSSGGFGAARQGEATNTEGDQT